MELQKLNNTKTTEGTKMRQHYKAAIYLYAQEQYTLAKKIAKTAMKYAPTKTKRNSRRMIKRLEEIINKTTEE